MINNGEKYSNELISRVSVDSGVSTAWLLATLGSKTTYKRLVKKDILNISIPETCNIIGNPHSTIPLRLSSNLLYGVSLMYKQKVDYFLSDVSLIKTRLQREILLNSLTQKQNFAIININQLQFDNFKSREKYQIFLKEDPLFDVSKDLLFSTLSVDEEHDERKLRIKKLDQQLYCDSNNSLFTTSGHITIAPDSHTKTIENFMDQELHTLDELDESLKSDQMDFEFDKDGEIVDIHKSGPTSRLHCDQDLSIIDFEQVIEASDVEMESFTGGVEEKTITNDKTFHLSHDTGTHQIINQSANMISKRKRNYRRVITDETLKIPSSELKTFRNNYNSCMNIRNKRIKHGIFEKSKILSINQLLNEENKTEPFAVKYSCKIVFGREMTRDIRLNSGISKAANLPLQLNEDLEFGRNIEPRIKEEEIDKFNFEIEQELPMEFDEDLDVFDLSFPEINNSELRSRSRSGSASKRSRSRSSRSSSSQREREFFIEESLNYTPGDPHLQTQKINSQTKITTTLIKFLNFLQSRSILLGKHIKGDYKLSRNYFQYVNKETTSSEEIMFSRIKFSTLIPLMKSKRQNSEVPVSRNLAANSFSSILELATRNYITLTAENNRKLQTGDEIELLIEI